LQHENLIDEYSNRALSTLFHYVVYPVTVSHENETLKYEERVNNLPCSCPEFLRG